MSPPLTCWVFTPSRAPSAWRDTVTTWAGDQRNVCNSVIRSCTRLKTFLLEINILWEVHTAHVLQGVPSTFITSDTQVIGKIFRSFFLCIFYSLAVTCQTSRGVEGDLRVTSSSWPAVLDISEIRLITMVKIQHKKPPSSATDPPPTDCQDLVRSDKTQI